MVKLLHSFVSAKTDLADATKIRPSDWNDPLQYANTAGTAPSGTDAVVREVLTANTTYYVATTGSDITGDGSIGTPWATPQYAYDWIAGNIDVGNFNVVISIADGTYSQVIGVNGVSGVMVPIRAITGGNGSNQGLSVVGNLVTPANVIFDCTDGNGVFAAAPGGLFSIQGVKFSSTNGNDCNGIKAFSKIYMDTCDFGTMTGGNHINMNENGYLLCEGPYTISGSALTHIFAESSLVDLDFGTAWTITGIPAFPSGFFVTIDSGNIVNNAAITSGTATGPKYSLGYDSVGNVIYQGGWLASNGNEPGNSAGIVAGGGRYQGLPGTEYYLTAIPAGGTAGTGLKFSSTANFGVFFGSGAPTLSAAKGSLYLRSDGTGVANRMYVNTNGSTTWTAVTTAA